MPQLALGAPIPTTPICILVIILLGKVPIPTTQALHVAESIARTLDSLYSSAYNNNMTAIAALAPALIAVGYLYWVAEVSSASGRTMKKSYSFWWDFK